MFINLINTEIPFKEYKLTKDELDKCRKRLLAIEPHLCITEEEEPEDADLFDVFYFVGDGNLITCIIPSFNEINTPSIFVLSDERDYEMDEKSVFDFLGFVYEKNPGFRLPNRKPVLDVHAQSLTGLMFNIASYLTETPKEPDVCTSYDNYYPRVQPTSRKFDLDEAKRLVHIVLTTMYNYPESYELPAKDLEELTHFGNTFAGTFDN